MSRHTITKKISSVFVTVLSCGAFFVNHPFYAMKENEECGDVDVMPLLSSIRGINVYNGSDTYVGTEENEFLGRREFLSPDEKLVVDQSLQIIRGATDEDKEKIGPHPITDLSISYINCHCMLIPIPDESKKYILVSVNRKPSEFASSDYGELSFARITNEGKLNWVKASNGSSLTYRVGPTYFTGDDLNRCVFDIYGSSLYDLLAHKASEGEMDKFISTLRSYEVPGFEPKKCSCIAF